MNKIIVDPDQSRPLAEQIFEFAQAKVSNEMEGLALLYAAVSIVHDYLKKQIESYGQKIHEVYPVKGEQ